MDREALYARLPVALQHVAVSLEGWRIGRVRFDAAFHAQLKAYCDRERWDFPRLRAYRDARLARFVEHAACTVPYYRDVFRRLGAEPGDFRRLEDLARLPLLDKWTVQDRSADLVSAAVPTSKTVITHTSGSTGGGLKFPITRQAQHEQWAVWWRFRRWHGLALGTPCCYFGGRSVVPPSQRRPPFWRHDRAGRQTLFSGYHLSPANAPAYLDEIERSGCRWIHGYPSLVALLASHALELGRKLRLGWVSLGAEVVLPHQSTVIQSAFGVEPISHYGMAEGVANVSLTPARVFVVDDDYAAVEFVPREDGRHDIVGTNFTNDAFPLIRYRVGDVATIPAVPATPDSPRTVTHIDGRQEDYVITRSGARLGRLDHVFKDMVNVREAQIWQKTPGEMTLHVVRGPHYSAADERLLLGETRKRVGDDVDFTIEYCEKLPRTARGKLRFVVSEIEEGRL